MEKYTVRVTFTQQICDEYNITSVAPKYAADIALNLWCQEQDEDVESGDTTLKSVEVLDDKGKQKLSYFYYK